MKINLVRYSSLKKVSLILKLIILNICFLYVESDLEKKKTLQSLINLANKQNSFEMLEVLLRVLKKKKVDEQG